MLIKFRLALLLVMCAHMLSAQVLINEVVSSNATGLVDEDNENVDWIELFNSSSESVNLEGYSLNDDFTELVGWTFPAISLPSKGHLIVFASGKDRKTVALKYQTIIDQGDEWQYFIPDGSTIDGNWRLSSYDASGWQTGTSGFGYGDGDDATIIQPLSSVFIRKEFNLQDIENIERVFFHVDYDDGFVAFLNGVPIAQENVYLPSDNADNATSNGDHEAQMFSGGVPSGYEVDLSNVPLLEGKNVLAVQGYNASATSSDFSLIPFLTIGSTSYAVNDVREFVTVAEGGLHANFKIDNDGEGLYLFNAQKELIDSVYVVALPANTSYGRNPDGGSNWNFYPTPTPGEANMNGTSEIRNDTIIFSHAAGFYPSLINIALSSSAVGSVIKYTTDGSEPDASSKTYTTPLTIPASMVVRAVSFFNGVRSGNIFTQTYLIDTNHELPVVSISTDPDNLWDYNNGILVEGPNAEWADPHYGANYWQEWEKPVNFEYFDKDRVEQINQGAGMKISGAWSRMNPQKSMALFARSSYGKGSFKYQFFKDREYDSFESILLRNSGNDWSYTMMRDGLTSEMSKNLNLERLAFQPTVVYLNGEYWGILNMRDKPNEHYFANLYDIDADDVNILESAGYLGTGTSNQRYMEMTSFLENTDLKSESAYDQVEDVIDVNCFIDYELVQMYVNNTDWPGNNIKFWNTTSPHSKYRWLLYDTEFGMNIYGTQEYAENAIQFATAPNGPSWPNPDWSTLLLRRMLTNDDFKYHFINRMADLLNSNFTWENWYSKVDSITAMIDSEIGAQQEKWGRSYSQWSNNVEQIYTFNFNRASYVRQHFAQYFNLGKTYEVTLSVSNESEGQIQVSTITPGEYPFQGIYFARVPVTFTAKPKPGYKFVRWENGSNETDPEITLTLTKNTKLHAVFEPTSDNDYRVVINEINYYNAEDYDSGDWIEIYNAGNQTIDLAGWKLVGSDVNKPFVFPAGNLLYPNNYLVICRNLKKFNTVYSQVKNRIGEMDYGLSANGEIIELYDVNNELVDQVMYGIQSPWPAEPLTTSATLELINPNRENNDGNNWEPGRAGGSPGKANDVLTSKQDIALASEPASCFPTRFSDFTTLRFNSNGSSGYSVKLMDIQGNIKNTVEGSFNEDGTHYLDIFTESYNYPNGLYLVSVQTGNVVETIKVIKF